VKNLRSFDFDTSTKRVLERIERFLLLSITSSLFFSEGVSGSWGGGEGHPIDHGETSQRVHMDFYKFFPFYFSEKNYFHI
jgi:hypothetical protein